MSTKPEYCALLPRFAIDVTRIGEYSGFMIRVSCVSGREAALCFAQDVALIEYVVAGGRLVTASCGYRDQPASHYRLLSGCTSLCFRGLLRGFLLCNQGGTLCIEQWFYLPGFDLEIEVGM